MKKYQLMHLEDVVADVTIDEFSGNIVSVEHIVNSEIVPYRAARSLEDFRQWWSDRAIPETRTALHDFLAERGRRSTGLYLLDNLGLSLTDCYWIRPSGASVKWKDVNLYENLFQSSLLLRKSSLFDSQGTTVYSPDASTGGNLPKWWIIDDCVRYLVKGNDGQTSQQSLNEVLATKIHTAQGWQNFVPYSLVRLPNSRLGCRCSAFTSTDEEFISAWDLVGRINYGKGTSFRNEFIDSCCRGGLEVSDVIRFLDYMAISDFIISNNDRHLNNFGILRDARSLKFTRMAPIFDSGNSMMYMTPDLAVLAQSLYEKTHGFYSSYKSSLEHVSDLSIFDISRLPSRDEIEVLYSRDFILKPFIKRLSLLVYQRAEIIKELQSGKSYYEVTRSILHQKKVDSAG